MCQKSLQNYRLGCLFENAFFDIPTKNRACIIWYFSEEDNPDNCVKEHLDKGGERNTGYGPSKMC